MALPEESDPAVEFDSDEEQPKESAPILEFDLNEEKDKKKSGVIPTNSTAAKKKKKNPPNPPKKGQSQTLKGSEDIDGQSNAKLEILDHEKEDKEGVMDDQDWNIDVPWNVDVPSEIWKDPSLLVKGEGAPQERLVAVDESCREEMHSLLRGRPEDVDEAWVSSWVDALMMEGETPLQTLRCIAFNGMPQVCGAIDCEGGKGLLILSKVSSKHRLHFVFQEQQQEIDAREEMYMNSQSVSSLCGSAVISSSEAALAQHSSTYKMLHRTIALEVEGNILLAHTEMRDLAKKTSNFDTSSSHYSKAQKPPCCVMCWPWCTLPCPQLCSCPGLSCCIVGEAVSMEKGWGNRNSVVFKRSFPCDEETCEDKEVTYTFPDSPGKKWSGKEHRTSKTAQMHLLIILYRLPGSATAGKFTAWIDPYHSVKSNARFAHELSASAKVDHAACDVSEPATLAGIFAQQFQFFVGSWFSSSSTSSSRQSKTQDSIRPVLLVVVLLALALIVIIAIAFYYSGYSGY